MNFNRRSFLALLGVAPVAAVTALVVANPAFSSAREYIKFCNLEAKARRGKKIGDTIQVKKPMRYSDSAWPAAYHAPFDAKLIDWSIFEVKIAS